MFEALKKTFFVTPPIITDCINRFYRPVSTGGNKKQSNETSRSASCTYGSDIFPTFPRNFWSTLFNAFPSQLFGRFLHSWNARLAYVEHSACLLGKIYIFIQAFWVWKKVLGEPSLKTVILLMLVPSGFLKLFRGFLLRNYCNQCLPFYWIHIVFH